MYFYIDESGHTGPNLFDDSQPTLYYGVLSSTVDLDVAAAGDVERARGSLGRERLHANEIGLGGLVSIREHLIAIQRKFDIRFDLCKVAKRDHAVISFYDQVFDHGVNAAASWMGYWTPLRYVQLLKLATLFDSALAERAWRARISLNSVTAAQELSHLCGELRGRVPTLPDARSRQLIGDALAWAAANPNSMKYNCQSPREVLDITPNMVGFQAVMHRIASRLRSPSSFASITVDQQSQFNKTQKSLAEFYASVRQVPWVTGPGLPKMDLTKMPTAPIAFRSSRNSVGLEVVDLFLWLSKRLVEAKQIPVELVPIIEHQVQRGRIDDVSLSSMAQRWEQWFAGLPLPGQGAIATARAIQKADEERRQAAMRGVRRGG
jgi:hypothetical protein